LIEDKLIASPFVEIVDNKLMHFGADIRIISQRNAR